MIALLLNKMVLNDLYSKVVLKNINIAKKMNSEDIIQIAIQHPQKLVFPANDGISN